MLNLVNLFKFKKVKVPSVPEVPMANLTSLDLTGLSQLERVKQVMLFGGKVWYTLEEVSSVTGDTTPSVSARLRDLRKAKFGQYLVERRKIHNSLYEYKVSF